MQGSSSPPFTLGAEVIVKVLPRARQHEEEEEEEEEGFLFCLVLFLVFGFIVQVGLVDGVSLSPSLFRSFEGVVWGVGA